MSRSLALSVAAGASALLLAGCTTAPVLTPVDSPVQPTPSAAPEVEVSDSPVPFLDIECADLFTEEELFSALGITVTPAPVDRSGWDGHLDPTSFALETLGGVRCDWNNGQPTKVDTVDGFLENPALRGLSVRVLPDATAEWDYFTSIYSDPSRPDFLCGPANLVESSTCVGNALVGTSWIEFSAQVPAARAIDTEAEYGVVETARTIPLWTAALERITAAPPTSELYLPPTNVLALNQTCEQLVTREEAQRVLGTDSLPFFLRPEGGWSQWASANRRAGAERCLWVPPDSMAPDSASSFENVGIDSSFLQGGGWAFDELRERAPARYEAVTPQGLTGDDSAYLDCERADDCMLHLIIGHSWIVFRAIEATSPGSIPVDRRTLVRLAELSITRLGG